MGSIYKGVFRHSLKVTRWITKQWKFPINCSHRKLIRKTSEVEVAFKEIDFNIKFGKRRKNFKRPIQEAWANPIAVTMRSSVLWIIFSNWTGQSWYKEEINLCALIICMRRSFIVSSYAGVALVTKCGWRILFNLEVHANLMQCVSSITIDLRKLRATSVDCIYSFQSTYSWRAVLEQQ